MKENEIRLLAVNPGSRYIGFAVFHDWDLVEWGVKSFREKSVKDKVRAIVLALTDACEMHRVDTLAIKALHPARRSKSLALLTGHIRLWAMQNGIRVYQHSIHDIETSVLPSGTRNKRRLMEEVAAAYPFLYPELEKEARNKNPYLVRMFEAVALSMTILNERDTLKGRKSKSAIHEKE